MAPPRFPSCLLRFDFPSVAPVVRSFLRAGSKDGETGLNVEPAKAKETEAFLHEVQYSHFILRP